jgi:hypothetical protein
MGRPSEVELRAASALLAPWRALTDARLFGLDYVPRRGPMLLVGIGPTARPRPERFYFSFGEPIDTTRYEGRHEDGCAARGVRDRVKRAVEAQMELCLAERERDPDRELLPRLLGRTTT